MQLHDLEDKLQFALSETRRLQNIISAASTLPPEVLSEIFTYLQYPINHHLSPYRLPSPAIFNSWTVVTKVCHYWRDVALATPALWDRIRAQDSLDWVARTSIQCSAGMPLKVYFSAPRGATVRNCARRQEAFRAIDSEAGRLQELHISHHDPPIAAGWNELQDPCPKLEALSIIGPLDRSPFPLPCLFSDRAPRLKKITFSGVSNWPHNRFSGLTHLRLFTQFHHIHYTLHQFLDILADSPGLEELVFIGEGPVMPSHPNSFSSPPSHRVRLPHLHTLELGKWRALVCAAFFLSHLDIPQSVSRIFWGNALNGQLSLLLNASTDGPYTSISRIIFLIDNALAQVMALKNGTLYISGPVSSDQYLSLFVERTFPDATELILWRGQKDSHSLPESTVMSGILAGLPSLETYTLLGYSSFAFHRGVASPLGLVNDGGEVATASTSVVAPFLNSLAIHSSSDSELVDVLPIALLLQHRAKIGHEIKSLVIEDSEGGDLQLLEIHCASIRRISRTGGSHDRLEDELIAEVTSMIHAEALGG